MDKMVSIPKSASKIFESTLASISPTNTGHSSTLSNHQQPLPLSLTDSTFETSRNTTSICSSQNQPSASSTLRELHSSSTSLAFNQPLKSSSSSSTNHSLTLRPSQLPVPSSSLAFLLSSSSNLDTKVQLSEPLSSQKEQPQLASSISSCNTTFSSSSNVGQQKSASSTLSSQTQQQFVTSETEEQETISNAAVVVATATSLISTLMNGNDAAEKVLKGQEQPTASSMNHSPTLPSQNKPGLSIPKSISYTFLSQLQKSPSFLKNGLTSLKSSFASSSKKISFLFQVRTITI